MVHEIKDKKLFERIRGLVSTPFFIPIAFLFFLIVTIPVITWVTSKPADIRQRAASQGLTARILVEPNLGTVAPNQTFTADIVVDGGGQPFNAAQATISVTPNLTVQSVNITPVETGGCNLTFANQAATPSVANLSFAGAILDGSSQKCTVMTVTLVAGSSGTGAVSVSNSQVKSSDDSAEIFLSSENGVFTISTTPANPIPQSTLSFSPITTSVTNGQTFTVQVRIDTNGQTVNGIESDITYPASIFDVLAIDDTNSDFNVPAQEVIGSGVLSIAYGSITPKSGDILVTTITFRAKATGIADVNFVNPSVVSDVSNTDVLKNFVNGQYTVTSTATTPTPTQTQPTSVPPTSAPTPTSVPPTSAPTPTPTVAVPTPTPTPAPLSPTPTPIPNSPVTITISTQQTATYKSNLTLSGSKSINATTIFVNNSSAGAAYTSQTTWEFPVNLAMGLNTFAVFGEDDNNVKSSTLTLNVRRNRVGDINGDDLIDLTDLSLFGSDWDKTTVLTNALSDMNDDNSVNLTDFSIFAKAYGH